MITTAWGRLVSAFSVHPSGPSPVADLVVADLAEQARRRARGLAWAGILINLPLFYIDDYVNWTDGALADDATHTVGIFAWRVLAVATLSAWLWRERRTLASPGADGRLAAVLACWFIVLGGLFGVWFETNEPSYALYGLSLMLVAVLIHGPSLWRVAAYGGAMVIALVGALLWGTPPMVVAEWIAPFGIPTLLIVFVDRALYHQTYRNAESTRLLSRANTDLGRAMDKLTATQARLVEAERQSERTRISRDLHDSVGAQLSSLLAGIELARLSDQAPSDMLDEVEADARQAMGQLRETVWVLNTSEVTVEALAAQLRRFAEAHTRRAGLHATVRATGDRHVVVPSAAALQLYRIGQEAVQNAVKHSGARAVSADVSGADGRVRLTVRDDGTFRPPVTVTGDGAPSGFGMVSMRERARELGGSFDLDTDSGTEVRVEVPV